jgi:hypothetical protein
MTKWFSDQYVPKLQRRVASLIVVELETSETKTITIGEVGETKVDLTRLPPELLGRVESDWPGIIMEWYFKPEDHSVVETDDVTEHWARFVGEILIPYDTAARSDVANRLGEVGARSVAFANSCRSNSSRQSQENVFNGRDIDLEDQDIPTV